MFSPGSTKTAIIEDETLLSQLEENVQVPMNTNSEYLVEAVCKIQKWWREKLRSKIQEAWDKSLDPPNWNSHFPSPLPVSFSEPYSPSEFEHALITLGKMYPSHKFLNSSQVTEYIDENLLVSSLDENSGNLTDEVFSLLEESNVEEAGDKEIDDELNEDYTCNCAKHCKKYTKHKWRHFKFESVEARRPHTRSMTAMQ